METIHIERYRAELGLRWPIAWYGARTEICRCVSDSRERRHEIWLTARAVNQIESYLPDIVHELCHLYLAERVDPAFATARFSEKWNRISRAEPERFGKAAQMLCLAWGHIDIWVNDLRHERWPELTAAEHTTFAQGVMILLQRQEWAMLSRPETLLGLAKYQAEQGRYDLKNHSLFAVLSAQGVEVDEKIVGLAEYFRSLPRLGFRPCKDLEKMETSVAEVAHRLEFSINPKLVFEKGVWVWDL